MVYYYESDDLDADQKPIIKPGAYYKSSEMLSFAVV